MLREKSNPRIPRKPGQPAGSKKHSDLYTDENPKGTIHGLGFKDLAKAKASVTIIKKSGKTHAHKIQAAIAMEQRARVAGKTKEAAVYRKFIEQMKKKTKEMNEDLRQWFSKTHPKGDWVRIGLDGEIKGPCAREEGEGKPKCLNRSRAERMTKAERAKAARRKRRKDPVADRKGKGGKPVNVKTEEYLIEKNVPTNPKLWSQAKALAKKKFDVYPSAYANGWAAKWYKKRGGKWKTLKEERQSTMKTTKDLFLEQLDIAQYGHIVEKDDGKDHEYEMARRQLATAATAIKRLMEKLGQGEGNLQAWVQSKLTKASDYIDSVADYMDAKDPVVKEAVELSNQVKEYIGEVVEDSEEETEVQYMVDKEGHKLDGEIIESYEVKSNGRVKVKTASGTGYIKEEDIALYEEEQGKPLGEFTHPKTGQKVLGMHHGVTDDGSHKIKIISGDNPGERMTVSPNDLSKPSHSSLRQSINKTTPLPNLPKPSIKALVSMIRDPRRD